MQYVWPAVKRSMWNPGSGQVAEPGFPLGFTEPTAHAVVSVKVELGLAAGGCGLSPK